MENEVSIFWFRRDLRLVDNAGLYYALKNNTNILPLFIFDENILNTLEDKSDKRVEFIHRTVKEIGNNLCKIGSSLLVLYGDPKNIFENIIKDYTVKSVYANHDYEPKAIQRDRQIEELLHKHNIPFLTFKDQCIFEKSEVTKDDGTPYTIFTPYSRKWKAKINSFYTKAYPNDIYYSSFIQLKQFPFPSLAEIGFKSTNTVFPKKTVTDSLIEEYTEKRNFPGIEGTSKLSIHLRFGTISIREITRKAIQLNETWLNEIIWRDFYMMILFHFPYVEHSAFKKNYNAIPWRNNEVEFEKWCEGKTGYPIVDAGMRELNNSGFMHNRVRMITASFLVKHLLIDWQWGEAYFAQKLLDFDLSANNGGWQWAASSGCDAAPYFRIFNPYEQTKRFDPHYEYIQKWVPEWQEPHYPAPIVDHKAARERVLAVYKKALDANVFN
jgi:deoxyribodipyrimidine photo-lyase